MGESFTILIAERNRHVREFLRREFVAEGYGVKVVGDDRELWRALEGDRPDALVLDLEIPYGGGVAVLERLGNRGISVPVVVHTFPAESADDPVVQRADAFVEKEGDTRRLKSVLREVLRRRYPHRFPGPRKVSAAPGE